MDEGKGKDGLTGYRSECDGLKRHWDQSIIVWSDIDLSVMGWSGIEPSVMGLSGIDQSVMGWSGIDQGVMVDQV